MIVEDDIKLDFSDVLIKPKKSTLASRSEVNLECNYTFKHSKQTYNGIPIMAANMDGIGTLDMATTLSNQKLFTCLVKSISSIEISSFEAFDTNIDYNHSAITTGINEKDYTKLVEILENHAFRYICIDVANGYTEHFGEFVAKLRKKYPSHTIIAGNVVTAEMTEELIDRGADIIKIGIGPGGLCTTRSQTGVGYPQLSAVSECADVAHSLGAHVISDGGCTCPGDVAKAFAAGADFVMLGSMLAGHDEGGGKKTHKAYLTNQLNWSRAKGSYEVAYDEKQVVEVYGMSSETAMKKHQGEVAEYRSSEGRTVEIPYRGPVDNTIKDILGGLRSTCTYTNSSMLHELRKNATFVRVNNQLNTVFANAK